VTCVGNGSLLQWLGVRFWTSRLSPHSLRPNVYRTCNPSGNCECVLPASELFGCIRDHWQILLDVFLAAKGNNSLFRLIFKMWAINYRHGQQVPEENRVALMSFFVFVYGLLNVAVCSWDYKVSSNRMNSALAGVWKEPVVAYLKVISHFFVGTEWNHEKFIRGNGINGQRCEPGIFQTWSRLLITLSNVC
jgi:hypothetical protein